MGIELLDVQPLELRFIVETKKQSSCSIQLGNKSDQYVAFKVKTTSPKKYCVRPNVGIIEPNGVCDFAVTMQVHRAALLDIQCKDKFLIQSTVVPNGIKEEDITSDMFAKSSGNPVEEKKMRVIHVCSPPSPVLAPVNGLTNQDQSNDTPPKDKTPGGVENVSPSYEDSEGFKIAKPIEGLRVTDVADTMLVDYLHELATQNNMDTREVTNGEIKFPNYEMEELMKQYEGLKSKTEILESKLAEAGQSVAKLTEERSKAMQEKEGVKRELTLMRRRHGGKTVHIGFPLLYVCMVALICLTLGYLMQ